ncbi:MAG: DNA-directed RNA polymerase subunit beta', partial [Candidatus Poribacteria bacterium]
GLMSKPSGEIIETPIFANLREGLKVLEYFLSTHGARKGLADTAIKTASSGYLTRKLVDVAQDVIVSEDDCGTLNGIVKTSFGFEDEPGVIVDKVSGRFAAEDIIDPSTGEVIINNNEEITKVIARKIESTGIVSVKVRSPLTCESERGICRKCYGDDLSTWKLVNIGEAVGTISAQSIGEPGTQLTMRTFHTGGAVSGAIKKSGAEAKNTGTVLFFNVKSVDRQDGTFVVTNRNGEIAILSAREEVLFSVRLKKSDIKAVSSELGKSQIPELIRREFDNRNLTLSQSDTIVSERKTNHSVQTKGAEWWLVDNPKVYNIRIEGDQMEVRNGMRELHSATYGTVIAVPNGGEIEKGKPFMEWDPNNTQILTEVSGKAKFEDIIEGVTMRIEIDETTGNSNRVIMEHKEENLHPKIAIRDENDEVIERYDIPTSASIAVEDESMVSSGDSLAKIPLELSKAKDIVHGLPRVTELFEARKPKDCATITEIDGFVRFSGMSRGVRVLKVTNPNGTEKEYRIPRGKHLFVREGDEVFAGDGLTDGPINPHDILRVKGEGAVQQYLVDQVQQVYRAAGEHINDKHVEIIVRQMMRKVRVVSSGNTEFLVGDEVDQFAFKRENIRVENIIVDAKGGKPADGETILQGITKASLSTESFFSAASFQQTTNVLTSAALSGKRDELRGFKENVIMGRLIPAGTGAKMYKQIGAYVSSPMQALLESKKSGSDEAEAPSVES